MVEGQHVILRKSAVELNQKLTTGSVVGILTAKRNVGLWMLLLTFASILNTAAVTTETLQILVFLTGCSTVVLATVVSALGGLVFGYELAIVSGALLQLKVDFGLTCVQQEALVSSLLLGALLASITSGCLVDRGRRKSILLSNILILGGSLTLLLDSYIALLLGRMIVGFAVCISSMSCCIFVSEMVAPDSRGFLVTLYESGITVGILGAYAVNYMLSDCTTGWKWMFGLAAVPTVIQLLSVCGIPSNTEESLHQQEADQSTARRGAPTSSANFCMMDFFKQKNNMKVRTMIGLSLVLFQQFTGQPNILSYASTIFHSVGFRSNASALLASLGLGCVKVCATLTSTVFSDRVGRRPLLIGGCSVMAACLISIALLSGESTLSASACDSEPFLVNGTESLHAGVESSTGEPLLTDAHDDGPNPLGHPVQSTEGQDSLIKWIIFLCMMTAVSAYSAGFGPSMNFANTLNG